MSVPTSGPGEAPFLLRLAALVERNGRFGAVIRLIMAAGFTATTFSYAYRGGADHLRPFAFLYLALTGISAGLCALIFRSKWMSERQFWLLPFLDIPVVSLERWLFVPQARMPAAAGLIALTYYLTFIALSLFSLDRRVVLATTISGMLAGLCLLLRSHVVPVLIPTGLITLALAGAASYKALGHLRNLLEVEAAQARELRRLIAELLYARETERSRIAHDLHDELGEQLSALGYAVALLRKKARAGSTTIAANLAELDMLLTRTRATVRSIVTDLRPPALDELGLKETADWLVRRTAERAGLKASLNFSGDAQVLDRERSTIAYRILQEALTNVVRHAGAQRIEVSLCIEEELVLEVRDDGAGFDPQARTKGVGLIGMRERAGALGGTLTLESSPGAGTAVRLSLPLGAPEAERIQAASSKGAA
jgi:signal transduction histidine kinase